MTPTVSIIIPTYNRVQVIDKALYSIIQQSYSSWECIIVDDGSQDNSVLVLKEKYEQEPRIRILERNREPKGAPTCRNIGLEMAVGEYIIFLDSDDYLLPFCIEQRIANFHKFPECDFLVFPMGMQGSQIIKKKEINLSDSYLVDYLSYKLAWSIMCPIWKKTFLNQINGFTEGYPRFNDPDLMIRALLKEKVKFKVFHDYEYDTVYIPAKMDKKIYTDKVFKSLLLFIPDICQVLNLNNKSDYKPYLANYLHLWFNSFYVYLKPSRIQMSLKLIKLFYKQDIITLSKFILYTYRVFAYALTKNFHNRYKWKLIDKRFYN